MNERSSQQNQKRFGDARDVEAMTDGTISRRMAWTMARRGDMPPGVAIRLGSRIVYDLELLGEWLRAGGTSAGKRAEVSDAISD